MSTDETPPFAEPFRASARTKRYHRIRFLLGGTSVVLEFAFFAALIVTGFSLTLARWASGWSAGRPWLETGLYVMALAALSELLSLPLGYTRGLWLERRFGLSRQTFMDWLKDRAKAGGLNLALMLVLVEILYALIRHAGPSWWLWAGGAFCLIFVILARLAPVLVFPLFYKFTPMPRGELRERLARLAERAGIPAMGVFRMDMSRKTRAANAALAGMGATRRILLGDTLIDRFTTDEIEAVIAHELGHHVRAHLLKGILIQTVSIFLFLWLVDCIVRPLAPRLGLGGLENIAALPLLALIGSALGVALLPAMNAALRRFERQADRYAVEATGSADALVSALRRLASTNLADPSPNPWIEFLFYSHPSIQRRVAFCEAVAREGGGGNSSNVQEAAG